MPNKRKGPSFKESYESDGKMGEKSKKNQEKGKEIEFFNTTQSSE
ncbi:hypothetical protein [Neobacillus sp. D3-1R]